MTKEEIFSKVVIFGDSAYLDLPGRLISVPFKKGGENIAKEVLFEFYLKYEYQPLNDRKSE